MTTPTEFHPFNRLPFELRDQIWKLLLRPLDGPGAHFFYVKERGREEKDVDKFQQYDVCITPLRMVSPYWLHTCVGDMPKRNRSMFMVDSALWTACKESRELMEKVFRPKCTNQSTTAFFVSSSLPYSVSCGSPSSSPETASSGLETASSSLENAMTVQTRHFTVFQNQDLFIYRILNWAWWPGCWSRVVKDGDPRVYLKKLGHFQTHLAIE
ncbi:hypothetical protein QBC32DRAFT_75306 [Pseudoneurospora amorphoporcata]|uniref:2EXR domain-containing protein n=1 Tax=Pseudoneurospora amorphoporcata TaxID=241081 RepID=A0AAN6NQ48_9PEZI|nr:hypothetical protein QBC32DRAFT_75306 [Pseudoneurospora amorphoporcata]